MQDGSDLPALLVYGGHCQRGGDYAHDPERHGHEYIQSLEVCDLVAGQQNARRKTTLGRCREDGRKIEEVAAN